MNGGPTVVLLGGTPATREFFTRELAADHAVTVATTEEEAAKALAGAESALLVVEDSEGGEAALAARRRLVESGVVAPMILLAGGGDEDAAIEALRGGFTDVVVRRQERLRADLVRSRIARSLEVARLQRENLRLRRSIEESQARLFNVYDSLDDAIMQIDRDCKVVSVNRSAAALASCEPREAAGRTCHELFDFYPCERRARKEECHIWRTFDESETLRGTRDDPKTRSSYQWMTFITTLKDADYVVYRETDVTEKRRLEERIAKALESLGVAPPQPKG